MPYDINKSDDVASAITVADGQINASALSIVLIGRGYDGLGFGFGEQLQENIVHIMENFSNITPPLNPTYGQTWFNPADDSLNVYETTDTWRDMNDFYDGSIYDIAVADDAQIQLSKLEDGITGQMIIVNGSSVPSYIDMQGDVLIDQFGNTTLQSNTVNTAEIASGVYIDALQIDASVLNANTMNVSVLNVTSAIDLAFVTPIITHPFLDIFSNSLYHLRIGTSNNIASTYTTDANMHYFNKDLAVQTTFRIGQFGGTTLSDGALNVAANGNPGIELRSLDGGTPTIDFSNDNVVDYDVRLQLTNDTQLSVLGGDFHIATGALTGQFGNIAASYDEWLRLNDTGSHTNGIHAGTSVVRTDGELQVGVAGATFRAISGGAVTINGNVVWHAGNAGTGNGYDVDMVDGYHAAEASTVSTLAVRDASGDISARLFRSEYDTTNPTINYVMTQIDTASDNYMRPSTMAQLKTSFGKANDSALLNGAVESAVAGNNTIVKRSSSGYIVANYFNTTAAATVSPASSFFVETGSDGYIRKQTPAVARGSLDVYSKAQSDALGGQTVGFSSYRRTASYNLSTSTFYQVSWSDFVDPDNLSSGTSSISLANAYAAGYRYFSATANTVFSNNSAGYRYLSIESTLGPVYAWTTKNPTPGNSTTIETITPISPLTSSLALACKLYQTSGTDLTLYATQTGYTWFSLVFYK